MELDNQFGLEYINRIKKIWNLNEPPVNLNTNDFYSSFFTQYEQARILSSYNSDFIRIEVSPLLNPEYELSEKDIARMEQFCVKLKSNDNLELIDWVLCFKIYKRLIDSTDVHTNRYKAILYTNEIVKLLYHICEVFRRESSSFSMEYLKKYEQCAFEYIEKIKKWLPIDIFSSLSTDEKRSVLCSNRMESLFWYPEQDQIVYIFHNRLNAALSALNISKNQDYQQRNPDIDWAEELNASLYYVTICNSIIAIDDEVDHNDLDIIYKCCLEQDQLVKAAKTDYIDEIESVQNINYMKYLFHEISPDEYINIISSPYTSRNNKRYDIQGLNENLFRPCQILEVLVHLLHKPEYVSFMQDIYTNIMDYALNMPNNEFREVFLVYTLIALQNFKEVDGGITFAQLSITLLANCSPSTYVHSKMVALISKEIAHATLIHHPEAFIGINGTKDASEVLSQKDDILDFAFNCALYHDIGKLPYLDTIGVTYRPLFPEEFDIIKLHSSVGYSMLSKYPSTKLYAEAAYGHHKWYDDTKGYPDSCILSQCSYRIITDIIAVSDCLDAATDIIFRSYNKGITLNDYIKECHDFSGTRYSPLVVDSFKNPVLVAKLYKILHSGRMEVYNETYQHLCQK